MSRVPSPETLAFYNACSDGNLSLCTSLVHSPSVDLNWKDPDWLRSPFYRACYFGHVEVVKILIRHPGIDVNSLNKCNGSPIYVASQNGHGHVVRLLLRDSRTIVDGVTTDGSHILFIACEKGHVDVIREILSVPAHVDLLNMPSKSGSTPLWIAAQNGRLSAVELLLGSEGEVDPLASRSAGDRTAAQQAIWASKQQRWTWEAEGDQERRAQNCPKVAQLIEEYQADKDAVRSRMKRLLHLKEYLASEVFALMVFCSDGYLRPRKLRGSKNSGALRFFSIAMKLPLELQMTLSNRVFGSSHDIVLSRFSEEAFRMYGKEE